MPLEEPVAPITRFATRSLVDNEEIEKLSNILSEMLDELYQLLGDAVQSKNMVNGRGVKASYIGFQEPIVTYTLMQGRMVVVMQVSTRDHFMLK